MPIELTCPKCSKFHVLPDSMSGKTGKCPCGASIVVPDARPAPPVSGGAVASRFQPPAPPARMSTAKVVGLTICAVIIGAGSLVRLVKLFRDLNKPAEADWHSIADLAHRAAELRCPPSLGFSIRAIDRLDVMERHTAGTDWTVTVNATGGPSGGSTVLYIDIRREGELIRVVAIKDLNQQIRDLTK